MESRGCEVSSCAVGWRCSSSGTDRVERAGVVSCEGFGRLFWGLRAFCVVGV